MRSYTAWVKEIRIAPSDQVSALISCPEQAIPQPGSYSFAVDSRAILGTALFLENRLEGGFLASPPVPQNWDPGTSLTLRGPLGRGFSVPEASKRLALVALGSTASRLLPAARLGISQKVAVALFTNVALPVLPSAVEVSPLASLPDALNWADFLLVDLPLEKLPDLRGCLGLADHQVPPCPGEGLVWAPMPCAGIAACGVCSISTRHGWKLACKDGPVFLLEDLLR